MMLSKQEYMDILDYISFFYAENLIATAELRKEKSEELQQKDKENLFKKLNILRDLVNECFSDSEQYETGEIK